MAAPQTLIYRIDAATAAIVKHRLVITAKGAVRSGGWAKPKLLVREISAPETHEVEVDFVATPPDDSATVAQVILPVNTKLSARLPRYGVRQVKLVSETNSMVVQIARGAK